MGLNKCYNGNRWFYVHVNQTKQKKKNNIFFIRKKLRKFVNNEYVNLITIINRMLFYMYKQ